ncbi:MAG: DNA-processing protein DprA [Burkholderiaceae bacterium]
MKRDEVAAWLRLGLTPGVGNETARRLLAAFGLPHEVFAQPAQALAGVAGGAQLPALSREPEGFAIQLAKTLRWLDEAPAGQPRRLLTLGDPLYPESLLETADPPLMLYLQGPGELSGTRPRLAVVGSRNPTPQGRANARQFSEALARSGLCVVSGLALGVDAAAHEGALEAAGETIAIVGTGLDIEYPSRNAPLARRIGAQGLLVSEYPLGTPPVPANFPRRNRIISGLSRGTLVVEAALQSGSLITARFAAEQGREVFAIPGSIHSPQSRGCHALIRQGAKLVESAQDVLEELAIFTAPAAGAAPAGAPANEDPLLAALGFDAASLDALGARTGLPVQRLQAALLEMELAGQVARLPGGLFQRVAAG